MSDKADAKNFGVSLQPLTRKSLLPQDQGQSFSLFKSFQTRNKLYKVVEGISNALDDPTRESYGRIGVRRFFFSRHSFNAKGCSWDVEVDYEKDLNIADGTTKPERERGSLPVKLQCYVIDDNFPSDDVETHVKHNDLKERIIVIDMTATCKIVNSEVDKVEKKVFEIIGFDVTKTLSKVGFPEFPEGLKDKTFKEIYQLNNKIKSGTFATVCLGTHRSTGTRVAVKCIFRKSLDPSSDSIVFNEVDVLASLDHKYICPLRDFFIQDDCYFIIMEYMAGGDLFDRLGDRKTYDESDAKDLCKKLLHAVAYCHESNIAHCDLKPKNLLLLTEDDDSFIKLADFGFAHRLYAPKSLTKQRGTPYFVAPEILLGKGYDERADLWSIGVITYCLLCGHLPFNGKKHIELFRSIVAGVYSFDEIENEISDDAKALVKGLLVTDPSQRWSTTEALGCRWIRSDNRSLLRKNSLMQITPKLKTFNARLKFKSAILAIHSIVTMKKIVERKKK